jgi:hypothetical protein
VALLVGLSAERLVESLEASTACSESIPILAGITAAIAADSRKENGEAGHAPGSGPFWRLAQGQEPGQPGAARTGSGNSIGVEASTEARLEKANERDGTLDRVLWNRHGLPEDTFLGGTDPRSGPTQENGRALATLDNERVSAGARTCRATDGRIGRTGVSTMRRHGESSLDF